MNKINHTRSKTLIELCEKIRDVSGMPKDYLEIAASLESMGYNDQRIKQEFGYQNVFYISKRIFHLLTDDEEEICEERENFEESSDGKKGRVFFDIIRGMLSACPLLISMFSVFVINFSLWSFMDKSILGVEQATFIALATILSMIVSAGFTQAFLRKGYGLIDQKYYKDTWRFYVKCFRAGAVSALFIAFVISIFCIFTSIYRFKNILIFDLYFLLMTVLWLNVQMTNIIKGEWFFVINLFASIGVVYYLKEIININIIYAQALGMLFFITINSIFLKLVLYCFAKLKKSKATGKSYKTRFLINMYLLAPYFLYGLMYYALIFADRLMAWSANSDIIIEPVMRMKGEYDLGMNWGILAIIIPTIFIEVYAKILINKVLKLKKRFHIEELKKFQKISIQQFIIHIMIFFALSVIGAIISVEIINNVIVGYNIELNPYFSNISSMVFYVAIVGYIFIVLGLLNNIYLLYFSQGNLIVKIVSISLGINLTVGFILSREFGYYFAVFGFLAGAIAFFALTFYYSYGVLKSLDYYFYKNS